MTMITHVESNLEFAFDLSRVSVLKLDDTSFYRERFGVLQGCKGVDFLVYDKQAKTVYFVEVKNFTNHEIESKNRLKVNHEESLSLEVALKVRASLACVLGAYKVGNQDISPFFDLLKRTDVQVKVVLFLEGVFKDEKILFKQHSDKIKKYLGWVTARAIVENSYNTKNNIFTVRRLPLTS